MPELPDVEWVRGRLRRGASGRRIRGVRVLSASTIRSPAPRAFARLLRSRRIGSIARRGKYLLLHLEGAWTLVVHLRMTGDLRVVPHRTPLAPDTRVVFELSGRDLRFTDQRRFGHMDLVPTAGLPEFAALRRLGMEPLGAAFTASTLRRMLGARRAGLKGLLLRQDLIAGIGNLYADEILFRARLSPRRTAAALAPHEVVRLHVAVRAALRRAVRCGAAGGDGSARLLRERRPGGRCPRCRRPLSIESIAGRTTYFCAACQR